MLYLGTETGLFVTIDRGRSWQRIKANLPTVRIDEITLHPRDNAMILGTHGRAIWVLDNLAPIQEYAAAQAATADAKLFAPAPAAMYRRPARDRNYEFWGDQVFYGENPPQAAVITWLLKKPAGEVALRITDAAGRRVREISGPVLANANKAGIQSACWDLRVQPVPAPAGARPDAAAMRRRPTAARRPNRADAAARRTSRPIRSAPAAAVAAAVSAAAASAAAAAAAIPDRTCCRASTTCRSSSTASRSTRGRCASWPIRKCR